MSLTIIRRTPALFATTTLSLALVPTACVNVAAPDKPIVIELNINIRQEVVYRIEGAVENLIEENAEIF